MSKRILVVEDDPLISSHIMMLLKKSNYSCQSVLSGEEAIELFKQFDPDLVLMDIGLGKKLDGISTSNYIRTLSDVPIIYITGETSKTAFELAKLSRPSHFIEKPFTDAQLVRAVELVLISDPEVETYEGNNALGERVMDGIFVYYGKEYIKVLFTDILYLEADGARCMLYCAESRAYKIALSSNHVINQINWPGLVRTHRSFYVNIHKVDKIGDGMLSFGEKHKVPLHTTYRDDFLSRINKLKRS